MKTFNVELKRVSYVTITVEAESQDHAEEMAWEELHSDGSYGLGYADWDIESVEELTQGEMK